jgi:hypothetical protein
VRRLIVNPGIEMAWDIPLSPARITLGRAENNNFVIDDPSIADTHCELLVTESKVIIKTLSSAPGIWINGVPVAQAELSPGQVFQIGVVNFQYDASASPDAPLTPSVMVAQLHCKIHPRHFARYFCPQCQSPFCDLCINSRNIQGQIRHICRLCAVECTPVELPVTEEPTEKTFLRQIPGAFAFPVRGDGLYSLVLGALMLVVINGILYLSLRTGVISFTLLLLKIFGVGFVVAYMKQILAATAIGEDRLPDWPEFTEFSSDILSPFLQMVGTFLFCFAPALILKIYLSTQDHALSADPVYRGLVLALIVLGCFYLPMAFTAVAMFDSVAAVNPLLILPSIKRVFWAYLLTVAVLLAILILNFLLNAFFLAYVNLPILPDVITELTGLYLLVVEVRLLGLLYRCKKTELGWF